ncbi:hypothetical protein [Tenacibaculum ovolyticum]|uniref:hypothetical protein n=1 Tax=Tenacibaculum ovolyticum TaxID=104270 RepID=UPI0007ED21D5|nr:hypothetical protein [Tenacibaculum ovolyticum]
MPHNYIRNYTTILKQVQHKIGKPVSVDVVIAIIESFGIKDKDTAVNYNFKDIKSLAIAIFKELSLDKYNDLKNDQEIQEELNIKEEKEGFFYEASLFIKSYLSNTSYLLAFVIQLTTIILFGSSLYAFVGFNKLQSTTVILGVILGMVLSGGSIQVIGNEISKHYYLNDFSMVRKMTFYLIKQGVFILISVLLFFNILNYLIPIYPHKVVLLTSIYAFLIGVLFLVFAPLHVLKSRIVIFISTTLPTFLGIYLIKEGNLNIYQIHFIGLLLAIAIVLIFILLFFKFKKAKKNTDKKYRTGVLFYNNFYFFLYGFLINIFFFIDRIIAWSSYKISNLFFPVFYEKDYEIGMDLAIIFFLLLAGSIEYNSTYFIRKLNKKRKNTKLTDINSYKKNVYDLYLKNVLLLCCTAIPIFILVQYIIYGKWGYDYFFSEPIKYTNIKVAQIAMLAYFFICWGILNTSYLTVLKRQKKALEILFMACIANIAFGFTLSRFLAYEDSVYGLLAGAILFAGLTLKENINILKNIDYHTPY